MRLRLASRALRRLASVALIWALALFTSAPSPAGQNPIRGRASKAQIAFTLGEKDLFPEGIACDPAGGVFYLSSLAKKKIVAVTADGASRDFIPSGYGGFGCGLGLKVDALRGELWALSSVMRGTRYESRASVFDLGSGRLLREYPQPDAASRQFNDLAVSREGTVYITDSLSHAVFRIRPGSPKVEPLAESAEDLAEPNGLALSADEKTLFVASTKRGLIGMDVASGRYRAFPNASPISSAGIDGMVRVGDSLYAVVNDAPPPAPTRVVRFDLDAAGMSIVGAEVLDEENPLFAIPTTCAAAGEWLYVLATSHLDKLDGEKARAGTVLGDIVVLKYALRRSSPGARQRP